MKRKLWVVVATLARDIPYGQQVEVRTNFSTFPTEAESIGFLTEKLLKDMPGFGLRAIVAIEVPEHMMRVTLDG